MRGGITAVTLPAGYLGSCFIGAGLIACVSLAVTRLPPVAPQPDVAAHHLQGFDTNASKVACLVLSVFFLLTLFWARKSWIAWVTIAFAWGLIVVSNQHRPGTCSGRLCAGCDLQWTTPEGD